MEIAIPCLSFYLIVGLSFAMYHVYMVRKRLEEIITVEDHLRKMIQMYAMSPKGAEYYVKLQDLHIDNQELIEESTLYRKQKSRYIAKMTFYAFLLWPLHILSGLLKA